MRSITLGVLALVLAGCGDAPKLVAVAGKVSMKGQPVTAGSIWFHPAAGNAFAGEKPSCQLELDGSFTMRTYPYGNGVPPGAWKVTLSPELANRLKKPEYSDPAKTPWAADVPAAGLPGATFEVK